MIVSSIVLAYHGCDRSLAERVVSGKEELKVSQNPYDWLGEGVYFWENSPRRALRWAEFLRDHPKISKSRIKEPAVVGAVIELGNSWLLFAERLKAMNNAAKHQISSFSSSVQPPPRAQ